MSISNFAETAILNWVRSNFTTIYAQVHVGDPGEACTSNPAANTSRALVTFASASSGSMTTSADTVWPSVSTTETYTHVSLWDAATSGNALWSGALTSPAAVTAGNDFAFDAGDLTLTVD